METPGQPPAPATQEPPGGWQQAPPPSPRDNPYAVKYPGGRVWIFSILSFGFYTFYWFYRNRKLLDGEYGDRDDAVLHTCGLLVPVLNYFITYWLWRDLNELRLRYGLSEFTVAGYLVGTILGLSPIFYSLALGHTNEYWEARTAGHAVDAPVTTEEKVIVGIGAAFLALFVLSFMLVILIVALASG
ncbi:MAG: hypothetical protein WD649_00875 [Thermoleophilaceae bacterium]